MPTTTNRRAAATAPPALGLPAGVTLSAGDLTPPKREDGDQWALLAGVRFVLAMVVLLHHLSVHLADSDPLHSADFGGLAAVMGFFVISGYSMANSLTLDNNAGRFYERRFWRIYPAYLVAILLAMLPCILFGAVFTSATPGFGESPDLREFLLACGFLQGFVSPGDLPANGVLWSLSIEVWLYALSPWLFRTSFNWLRLLAVGSIGVYLVHDYIDPSPLYANTNGLAFLSLGWAFLAGFAYYRYAEKLGSVVALLLIGVLLACVERERFGPINFALVIAVVALTRNIKLNPKWRKPLLFAGSISYPLYLVHVPVIETAVGFGYANGIVIASAALLLACLVHLCIETPVAWYRKRRTRRRLPA